MDEICRVRPPPHTLKIWGAWVNSPRSYGAEFLFFCLSVCPSRYVARHRKPRRCVYVLNLGGTGIRPPDSFNYRSNFRSRSRSSSCSTTSGDIFYCSGSRQLNHSSLLCCSYNDMPFSAFQCNHNAFLFYEHFVNVRNEYVATEQIR